MTTHPWKMRYAGHLGLRSPDAPLFRRSAVSRDPTDQIHYLADLGFAGGHDLHSKLRPPEDQARIAVFRRRSYATSRASERASLTSGRINVSKLGPLDGQGAQPVLSKLDLEPTGKFRLAQFAYAAYDPGRVPHAGVQGVLDAPRLHNFHNHRRRAP